jgi:hypothetical protein
MGRAVLGQAKALVTDTRPPGINGGSRPVPDPTLLTTEQLLREINNLASIMNSKMEVIETRQKGFEKVSDVQNSSIREQFAAIEAWRKEQKLDTKTAVDAALQAAEKAVREQTVASEKAITKSETSATEQSKQQYATFTASLKGVVDTVADLKDRVGTIEAIKIGGQEMKSTARLDLGMIVSLVSLTIVIISVFVLRGG